MRSLSVVHRYARERCQTCSFEPSSLGNTAEPCFATIPVPGNCFHEQRAFGARGRCRKMPTTSESVSQRGETLGRRQFCREEKTAKYLDVDSKTCALWNRVVLLILAKRGVSPSPGAQQFFHQLAGTPEQISTSVKR